MKPEDRIKQLGSADAGSTSEAEWLQFRGRAHRSVRARRIVGTLGATIVVLLVVGFLFTLRSEPVRDNRGPGIAGTPTDSPSPTPAPTPRVTPTPPPNPPNDPMVLQQWFIENDKLMLFQATVEKNQTPARTAVGMLLGGVPSPLAETGVETAIPEGTALGEISIVDGTAEVTLAGDFPDDSDAQQNLAIAQLVYTLTQFASVDDVTIAWESPESGGTAIGPETREQYQDYLPPIVVETPYAGQSLAGKDFRLSGIASVFEATVNWQLVDQDGNVVQEGFTTATCGTGCWGTFEDEIRYRGNRRWVELQVFEPSAEDGSPLHLVQLPINFGKKEKPDGVES